MKTLNNYTFKSWHNGAGEDVEFTVRAETVEEAYEKAYQVCNNTLGLEPDVELVKASVLLQWEVCVCDVDGIPGADWTFHVAAYSSDEAEDAIELAMSEKRVEYTFLGIFPMQDVPDEELTSGPIRILNIF